MRSEVQPKDVFTYIRTKKTRSNIGLLKDEDNALTQDNEHMEEILNKSFVSVFTVENTQSVAECPAPPRGITPLEIGTVNEREVVRYLDKLDTNKFIGPDALPPRLLKELKQQILKPLTDIYNLSLQQNKVPEDWK